MSNAILWRTNQYRSGRSVVDPRVEISLSVDSLVVTELRTKDELDFTQSRSGRRKVNLNAMIERRYKYTNVSSVHRLKSVLLTNLRRRKPYTFAKAYRQMCKKIDVHIKRTYMYVSKVHITP